MTLFDNSFFLSVFLVDICPGQNQQLYDFTVTKEVRSSAYLLGLRYLKVLLFHTVPSFLLLHFELSFEVVLSKCFVIHLCICSYIVKDFVAKCFCLLNYFYCI